MFRTEVDHKIGRTNIFDWMVPVQLKDENTLRVVDTPAYKQVSERLKKSPRALCGHLRNGLSWPCQVHQQYVSPREPLQGMWMASRRQLASFMAHPYWNKESALNTTIPVPFGYPERSNGMNILINVPTGYLSNCTVPLIYIEGKVEDGKVEGTPSPDCRGGTHAKRIFKSPWLLVGPNGRTDSFKRPCLMAAYFSFGDRSMRDNYVYAVQVPPTLA
jgi:hypothetical protein